ncbi:ATPase WRNIP1 [Lepisosteus oculatus]|uniref:ATPase WRNIP1 n=1 Tax=Lepisosteus oculatus TaxID=7918 RepID=UPI003710E9EC
MAQQNNPGAVQCPVCSQDFEAASINSHLDVCLLEAEQGDQKEDGKADTPPCKKSRTSADTAAAAEFTPGQGAHLAAAASRSAPSAVFSVFQGSKRTKPGEPHASVSSKQGGFANTNGADLSPKGVKAPGSSPRGVRAAGADAPRPAASGASACAPRGPCAPESVKPLAERMRPDTLEEYFGQNKVLGENTLLRSLLESQEVPSLVLWGPPGCGKTTLAHIIAGNIKRNGGARFVSLSATSATTAEVREVIKQAQNELRLFKRRTVLFIDEIHRFNKAQQDTFLPHVECGTVTLIGATTENPSFQVNAALLSRCRVIVLEKLSVEAMEAILLRAVGSLGVGVLQGDRADSEDSGDGSEPRIYIEQKALSTIAHLCDGDARTGLNGLQLAVQARISAARLGQASEKTQPIIIQEDHVKEGLQRSHILYDRAGEEHYNCISALHKSMRGSHENAALYWLGRMLEGGEDPLYVARRLVRFASEDVGLADPMALTQAVSAFQACHVIGMPECDVILAQCAVYLARAPKSVEVYKAYGNVKACLRNHQGPLPPVPLHLRNAPTRLMKNLGYAKGYKYNPAFSEPVEQDYLPEELKEISFFDWTPANV